MFTTELQYTIVRYMLNDLADEAVNVGLLAVTEDPPWTYLRLLEDPTTKSRNDVRVNAKAVERFNSLAERTLDECRSKGVSEGQFATSVFEALRSSTGNIVRLTLPRSVLTNDRDKEVQVLFDQLIAPKSVSTKRAPYSPRDPLRRLRTEASRALVKTFRDAYGKPLSRKRFAKKYEISGQYHKKTVFDLAVFGGTKKNPKEHLFQHVILLPDPEESFDQAAALTWRWQDIKAANHKDRKLTAILYGRSEARGSTDARNLLEDQDIEVARITQLRSVVEKLMDQGQERLFSDP